MRKGEKWKEKLEKRDTMHAEYKNRGKGARRGIAPALVLWVFVGLLSGCAGGGNYGHLIGAADAYSPMRQGPIGADYQYYQTPDRAQPDAIIAIYKDYTLDAGDDWTVVDLGAGSQSWGVLTGGLGSAPMLLEIQGPAGQHVGLWYSVWTSTVVKMEGGNRVQVYPPDTATGPGNREDRR
jgi:hypothetical protein